MSNDSTGDLAVLDLFAGPGGWDEGLRLLGVHRVLGLEWDAAACATAEAAGHARFRGDLSMLATSRFGPYGLLIASPPCQAWSAAGKGLGKLDKPRILAHVARIGAAGRWLHYSREGWHDSRSPLVLESLRYVLEGRPALVAFEQVPAVLELWEAFADVLRGHGYTVATAILTAEQFGVAQTRRRAILAAKRDGTPARLPSPTHQPYRKGRPVDDSPGALPRWYSMAEALGWGMTARPSMTVTAGGGKAGGAEPFGNGARQSMRREFGEGRWTVSGQARNAGPAAQREPRGADEPSYTIRAAGSGSHPSGVEWVAGARFGNQPNSAVRSVHEPAATIRYSSRANALDWVFDRPAPTIVGTRRSSAGMLVGRQLPRGERECAGGKSGDVGLTGSHLAAVRVTVEEAAVLQSFRVDYPWQGGKTKQYEQVGNAIPPLLAAAILGELLELPWQHLAPAMWSPAGRATIEGL